MWSTEISVISMALTESNHFLINVRILLFCLRMNPFHTSVLFLYPLKMSENLWFSDVFRRYGNGNLAWKGLIKMNPFLPSKKSWNQSFALFSVLGIDCVFYPALTIFKNKVCGFNKGKCKGVFRTLKNMYHGAFLRFCKKGSS